MIRQTPICWACFKKKGGDHATIVGNGVEALKFPNDISFDILLTDWMMLEIDGI